MALHDRLRPLEARPLFTELGLFFVQAAHLLFCAPQLLLEPGQLGAKRIAHL